MSKLTFRIIRQVTNRSFQRTSTKTPQIEWDETSGKPYMCASGDCVKHNFTDRIVELTNAIVKPIKTFHYVVDKKTKKASKSDGVQVGITTELDLDNAMTTLGCMSIIPGSTSSDKYKIKSSITCSNFLPVHVELTRLNKEVSGVCVGNENDRWVITDGEKEYTNAEDLYADGYTDESVKEIINNNRRSNFYSKQQTTSGLFNVNWEFDLDHYLTYVIKDLPIAIQEKVDEYVEKGWSVITVNGEKCLRAPMTMFEAFTPIVVRAIHTHDFNTNDATTHTPMKVVRTMFGIECAQSVSECTRYDKFNKRLVVLDNVPGVSTHNTSILNDYINCDELGINYGIDEVEKSINDMTETILDYYRGQSK